MRGGSSKGAYFEEADLPAAAPERDDLLMRILGTPDPRQIDGIGGAHPLTSKVAVVRPSTADGIDLDYLFLQVQVDRPEVSDSQNCGNLLAGVGPFGAERGLIEIGAAATEATVRILMRNTGSIATATFGVRNGRPVYEGHTAISSVPGTAAAIRLDFEGIAGGSAGALLPTGAVTDHIDGVACTLIDNGMPVVVTAAASLGVTGYESCAELEADSDLRARLEAIRLKAGPLMNLGDVAAASVPKLTLVAPPRRGGHLCTRTFIPHRCHDAIGVLGAVSVGTAARLAGSPAANLSAPIAGESVVIEHPTGSFEAVIALDARAGSAKVERAGIVRTARMLMDGHVFPRPSGR